MNEIIKHKPSASWESAIYTECVFFFLKKKRKKMYHRVNPANEKVGNVISHIRAKTFVVRFSRTKKSSSKTHHNVSIY